MPELPPKPDFPTEKPRGSWLGILLAGGLALSVIVVLTFLTIGYFGPVIVVGAVMAGVVVFHYVVWGWWLQPVLRRAMEEEEAAKGARTIAVISFIIPAHNEETLIGRAIDAIRDAASALNQAHEIIVVNDSSDDRTREVALAHGAQVIDVNHRQIAATRNSGAQAARGETYVFVDGDTFITVRALRGALRALRRGAAGGGALARFDGGVPLYGAILIRVILPVLLPMLGLSGGCFLFCPRANYFAAGGFSEQLFCAEEVAFAERLKRLGRFVVLRDHVITSGRKIRTHTALDMLRVALRIALEGRTSIERREGLEFWYGRRT